MSHHTQHKDLTMQITFQALFVFAIHLCVISMSGAESDLNKMPLKDMQIWIERDHDLVKKSIEVIDCYLNKLEIVIISNKESGNSFLQGAEITPDSINRVHYWARIIRGNVGKESKEDLQRIENAIERLERMGRHTKLTFTDLNGNPLPVDPPKPVDPAELISEDVAKSVEASIKEYVKALSEKRYRDFISISSEEPIVAQPAAWVERKTKKLDGGEAALLITEFKSALNSLKMAKKGAVDIVCEVPFTPATSDRDSRMVMIKAPDGTWRIMVYK